MYRFLLGLSRAMAFLGGAMLVLLIAVTCLSIAGRAVNDLLHTDFARLNFHLISTFLTDIGVGPILGDYELVEAGTAFAIFAFLPLCQLTQGHAKVDIFARRLPVRAARALQASIDSLFALALIVITVQLYGGMVGKRVAGQVSFLLEYPVWWGYALALPGAATAAGIALFVAVIRWAELSRGRAILPRVERDGP